MNTHGAFIGPLGGLVEVAQHRGSLGVTDDQEAKFKTTLGGGRRGFLTPALGLRAWSVDSPGLSVEQSAAFRVLMLTGAPPFLWVDPSAQVMNVLSPRGALPGAGNEFAFSTSTGNPSAAFIDGIGQVPAVTAASGSYLWLGYGCPVLPGAPVTVSAYVRGSGAGEMLATFISTTGAIVGTARTTFATPGNWDRFAVSGIAPAGASEVRIRITSSAGYAAALPAVTWTSKLRPWSPGRGARKVIAHDVSDTLRVAGENPCVDLSFTVTEVGDGA